MKREFLDAHNRTWDIKCVWRQRKKHCENENSFFYIVNYNVHYLKTFDGHGDKTYNSSSCEKPVILVTKVSAHALYSVHSTF
jgi:hypothetical protein